MSTEEVGAIAAIFGFVGIILLFVVLISAVVTILYIAGLWKMFEKAGEDGWKALIPVYNLIILCKIVGVTPWWLLVILICYVLNMVPFIGFLAYLPTLAAYYYFLIILGIGTARSYGKEDVWAVGFVLIPWIFYPLIGFNKDVKYLGVKKVKDPVWDWFEETFDGKNKTPEAQVVSDNNKVKYCSKCGEKLKENIKECPKCGKKI